MEAKQNGPVMYVPVEAVGDAATRAHPLARLAPGAAVLTSVLAGCAARAAAALASSSLRMSCRLPPAARQTLTLLAIRKVSGFFLTTNFVGYMVHCQVAHWKLQ